MGLIWLEDMSKYNKYRFLEWSNEKRIELIEMLLYKRVIVLMMKIDKRHIVSASVIGRNIRKVEAILEYLEKINSGDYTKEEQSQKLDALERFLFGKLNNINNN